MVTMGASLNRSSIYANGYSMYLNFNTNFRFPYYDISVNVQSPAAVNISTGWVHYSTNIYGSKVTGAAVTFWADRYLPSANLV